MCLIHDVLQLGESGLLLGREERMEVLILGSIVLQMVRVSA